MNQQTDEPIDRHAASQAHIHTFLVTILLNRYTIFPTVRFKTADIIVRE